MTTWGRVSCHRDQLVEFFSKLLVICFVPKWVKLIHFHGPWERDNPLCVRTYSGRPTRWSAGKVCRAEFEEKKKRARGILCAQRISALYCCSWLFCCRARWWDSVRSNHQKYCKKASIPFFITACMPCPQLPYLSLRLYPFSFSSLSEYIRSVIYRPNECTSCDHVRFPSPLATKVSIPPHLLELSRQQQGRKVIFKIWLTLWNFRLCL
jgi:hypothetical protein